MTSKFEAVTQNSKREFDTIDAAKNHLVSLGYFEGAEFVNDDGVQVIEYWHTAEAASTEQAGVSPAYVSEAEVS